VNGQSTYKLKITNMADFLTIVLTAFGIILFMTSVALLPIIIMAGVFKLINIVWQLKK